MNDQIDDFAILGFSFTQQQLEDLRAAIDVAVSTFEESSIDPNEALTNRLKSIGERMDYMISKKAESVNCNRSELQ
jgi:hypothetical protein